jgi:hypothetical protein
MIHLRSRTRRKHVEEYAESGREVRRGSDRTNLFDDGGMGARFERRLVCVNQHHGVALGNPIADGEAVAHRASGGRHSVVGIAAGGMALVFGGELSEFAKRSCYAVIATAVIVGAGTIMSTLFSSSSAVIAMTGGF